MQIVSSAPFPCASVTWLNRPQGWVLTVLCKATFSLAPSTSPLAEDQEAIFEADEHWDDDPNRSLRVSSDLVPYKPRADVVLVGAAYAPQQAPVRSIIARLLVGDVDKSIEVSLDRWFQPDGSLAEGPRFTRMPLLYERAGSGREPTNPVGLRAAMADSMGRVRVPNITWPGATFRAASDIIEPAGYGPLAPSWPARRERLGALAQSNLPARWYEANIPEGFDFRHFNAAPQDQQTDFLAPGARILLENLHPTVTRLVTTLPSLQPLFQVEGRSGQPPQPMRADTLWIDTDRLRATLTFRAQIPLRQRDEPGEVKMWMDRPPIKAAAEGPPRATRTLVPPDDDATSTNHMLLRAPTLEPRAAQSALGSALPFRPAQDAASAAPEPVNRPSPSSSALPFLHAPASSLSAPAALASPPQPPMFAAPPVSAPPPVATPPASEQAFFPPKAVPPPLYPASAGISTPVPSTPNPWASPISSRPSMSSSPEIAAPPMHDAHAAFSGVVAASDAAASHSPPPNSAPRPELATAAIATNVPTRRRAPQSEYLDLLWFDERAPSRIRQQSGWAEYVRDPSRPTEWIIGEEPEAPTPAVLDRRDVRRALGRVPPLEPGGIARAVEEAIDEDGIVERPLVIVNGELAMTYGLLETLKTTVAVASQLAGADKRLKEALDAAQEGIEGPRIAAIPLLDGALSRVRQAFAQANRTLAVDYLETTVQRILIEERHYQRRKLFGGPHIGGLLHFGSGSPLPTYLPEELAEKLPLFPKFRVRAIAEPHAQQDPADGETLTLRLLALGRVVPSPVGRTGRSS